MSMKKKLEEWRERGVKFGVQARERSISRERQKLELSKIRVETEQARAKIRKSRTIARPSYSSIFGPSTGRRVGTGDIFGSGMGIYPPPAAAPRTRRRRKTKRK